MFNQNHSRSSAGEDTDWKIRAAALVGCLLIAAGAVGLASPGPASLSAAEPTESIEAVEAVTESSTELANAGDGLAGASGADMAYAAQLQAEAYAARQAVAEGSADAVEAAADEAGSDEDNAGNGPESEAESEAQSEAQNEAGTGQEEAREESATDVSCAVTLIQADGNVDAAILAEANAKLSCVPQGLLDAFTEAGWVYYLSAYDVDDTYCDGEFGSLKGITDTEAHVIYVENRESALSCVVHEFGHAVDELLGQPSLTDEFAELFDAESAVFCDVFDYSNGQWYGVREFFAEAFKVYCENPGELADACPMVYGYLAGLLADYE